MSQPIQQQQQRAPAKRRWKLAVGIQRERGGPDIDTEPVADADLAEHRSELWMAGCLRRGYVDCSMESLHFEIAPLIDTTGNRSIVGFELETADPAGQQVTLRFSIHSIQHVARRAAARLMARGDLEDGDLYYYRIIPRCVDLPAGDETASAGTGVRVVVRETTPPLHFLRVPLAKLLERARAVDIDEAETAYPVFYTRSAREKAERVSRRGADVQPAVETGGLLLAVLCICPTLGELFALVTDVLELRGAKESKYSLDPSGLTWQRVQGDLRAARARRETRWHVPVGQCHGHNFLPGETGLDLPSSAFVSPDDRLWHRAVFSRQPYQLCHIFGLDRDGDPADRVFGLADARLLARGYHVVPDFDLTPYLEDVVPCVPQPKEIRREAAV